MQGRYFRRIEDFKSVHDAGPSLPFSELLTEQSINDLLEQFQVDFRERIYTPVVTLWIFLSQVLAADQSCRSAIANYIAFRVARGQRAPSLETTSYCQARIKLPEALISTLAVQTGKELHSLANSATEFRRPVKVVDGSTASMPDELANSKYFGKASNQYGEVGFPIARFVAVFCLASGALIEMAVGPYAGKKTGELSLFRQLMQGFDNGDILLADQLFCNYCDIARLLEQGVDVVMRLRSSRRVDYRKGKRLGTKDHVVHWELPDHCPDWLTSDEFAALPKSLSLRELRIEVTQPGFRSKTIDVLTSLLDHELDNKSKIGDLFRRRWQAELDLRSIKVVLQMDVLRCKTPSMVKKEIWTHMLGYNLLRNLMCSTAQKHEVEVREISFKGVQQLLAAFWMSLVSANRKQQLNSLCEAIVKAGAAHKVGNRPNRFEPRKRKRHPKPYPAMKLTRKRERGMLIR